MDTTKLIAAGLSEHQALAYALLLEQGEISPPVAAKELKLSRTNTYKVFDRLIEMGLATRVEKAKRFAYLPSNPSSLTRLAAESRNEVMRQEQAVRDVINELTAKYRQHTDQPDIKIVTGKSAVADAYRSQIKEGECIYFLRSTSDIATMGFDNMSAIRSEPERHGIERFGITPDQSTKPSRESALNRTWVRGEDYTAPVEWSVSGENLMIVIFGDEPHAITIENPLVANGFRQIWHLLNDCLRSMPYYSKLPR